GIAPPGAGAGAGRVDEDEVDAAGEIGERIVLRLPPSAFALRAPADRPFGCPDLHVAGAGALEALVHRREAALVEVGGKDLPAVPQQRGERQRLAAGAGAEVDHLVAGPRARQERGELRALVLHLDMAGEKFWLGVDRDVTGIGRKRDAQADRRP